MRRILLLLAACLLGIATGVFAQGYTTPPVLNPSNASVSTPLVVPYSAGQITVGGYQQQIPLGTVTLIDNQYACGAPQFAACNFIYWSPGTAILQATNVSRVAFTLGNVVFWYVTTAAGAVTGVVAWNLSPDMPAGMASSTNLSATGMRGPICNALLQQGCQASTGSLSGY